MIKNNNNNENIPVKLTKNIVISKSLSVLPLGYMIFKRKLAYNKEQIEIAKL